MADTKQILESTRTIAVVGCSRDTDKTAHRIPARMQEAGFEVIPVNPNSDEILGERCYASLDDLPEAPDLVNVFRPSNEATDVVRQAVALGPKAIWLQQGIVSPDGRRLAEEAGIAYVENRCIAVERARLGVAPNRVA